MIKADEVIFDYICARVQLEEILYTSILRFSPILEVFHEIGPSAP